jgi:hypothetical protein
MHGATVRKYFFHLNMFQLEWIVLNQIHIKLVLSVESSVCIFTAVKYRESFMKFRSMHFSSRKYSLSLLNYKTSK